MRFFRNLFIVFLILFGQVSNAQDARQYCNDLRDLLDHETLFDNLRDIADQPEILCRKDWVRAQDGELLACGEPRLRPAITPEFASIADRGLGNGSLLSPAAQQAVRDERTVFASLTSRSVRITDTRRHIFVGLGLAKNAREVALSFPTPPQRDVSLTMCEIHISGRVSVTGQVLWPDPVQPTAPPAFEINAPDTLRTDQGNAATTLVVVAVDFPTRGLTEEPVALGNSSGEISLRNRYECQECEVFGIADLHVHQMAELAFAGRLLWGSHAGDPDTALPRERLTGSLGNTNQAIQRYEQILTDPELDLQRLPRAFRPNFDANMLMRKMKNKTDDEGFVRPRTAGWPNFEDWPHHADRSHQQVHEDWLQEAVNRRTLPVEGRLNLSFMINSLVNNNFLCSVLWTMDGRGNVPTTGVIGSESAEWGCTDFENLDRQIRAAQEMEVREGWYRIALSAWHAQQIIREGDLAVMLAMESDHPLSGPDGGYDNSDFVDILDFYMSRGVRSLQPVHEADSVFCGAALHRGDMNNLQFWQWPGISVWETLQQGNPFNIDKGDFRNRLGLTEDGERLIEAMVERNLPIDLAHGSIACQRDIMAIIPEGYPLYSSHTKFEHLLRPRNQNLPPPRAQLDHGAQVIAREKNFLIPEDMEQAYVDANVMLGLRTASVDVYEPDGFTDREGNYLEDQLYYVPNDCPGSSKSFAQMVKYASDLGLRFAFGTDFNTGVSQLGPRFGDDRCFAASPDVHVEWRSTRPVITVGDQWPLSSEAQRTGEAGRDYYIDGLAHIGLLPELAWDLIHEVEAIRLPVSNASLTNPMRGMPAAQELASGAQNFTALWDTAYGFSPDQMRNRPALPATNRMAGVACERDNQCLSNACEGQIGGRAQDRVCGCTNAGTGCTADEICATPFAGQTFCVVPQMRAVGESCFTDQACASGRCKARDGREGICMCNLLRADSGCREGTTCVPWPHTDLKVLLLPKQIRYPPLKLENSCR